MSAGERFLYLLSDEFPPFGGEEGPGYPVRIGVPAPLGEYSRLKTGLRLIIGIPVMLLAIVQGIILYVVSIIAWFAILFTGKLGEGLFDPMRSAMAYLVRTSGYFLLITEDWPPFSYEEAGDAACWSDLERGGKPQPRGLEVVPSVLRS